MGKAAGTLPADTPTAMEVDTGGGDGGEWEDAPAGATAAAADDEGEEAPGADQDDEWEDA